MTAYHFQCPFRAHAALHAQTLAPSSSPPQRLHMAGCPQGVQASALEALASMEVDLSRPSVPCVYWR